MKDSHPFLSHHYLRDVTLDVIMRVFMPAIWTTDSYCEYNLGLLASDRPRKGLQPVIVRGRVMGLKFNSLNI